ncbi:MAG: flagellin [Pseudomonadota bacterium]
MSLSINTNVNSLTAQRNLGASQSSLATSMQRLSSGLRVNSAKDDAAGLAISERMNTQIRGLNVAARNANDGISLAQTAEGALGKIGDMLQRMRELAVQSANATNNQTDRDALQAEVGQLKEEIQRVASTTKFNGTALLDGSFTSKAFQVGANSGETITLASVANAQLAGLGTLTPPPTYSQTTAAAVGAFATGIVAGALSINGVGIVTAATADAPTQATALDAAFAAAKAANPSALANVTMTAGVITSTDQNLTIAGTMAGVTGITAGTTAGTATPGVQETGIANLTIGTAEDAASAMDAIDSALTAINTARGTLGAVQSRFENAIANIQVTSENLSAARGRIVDADFAAETANMSRANILQQAGTAMVAQANQLPQQVLQLLR